MNTDSDIAAGAAGELAAAVAALRRGEVIGLPTETVYGLAADASNAQAVRRIFALKGRPADHPLIVHLADASALPRWARDIPAAALALADAFWPGPLTLILARHPSVPTVVTGGQDTVGLLPGPSTCLAAVARLRRWARCAIGQPLRPHLADQRGACARGVR
jgi:L-threonylcarbamoyladenylate synthase